MGGLFFAAERSYVGEHGQKRPARERPAREKVVTPSQVAEEPTRGPMPGRVRWAVVGLIGLALVGALYLVSVRGEALLLDLKAAGGVFCF